VDKKPLSFALDALVRPAFALGIVAIGVGQFPIDGYRYFLPFFFFLYFFYMSVLSVHTVRWTRSLISFDYSRLLSTLGIGFLQYLHNLVRAQSGSAHVSD